MKLYVNVEDLPPFIQGLIRAQPSPEAIAFHEEQKYLARAQGEIGLFLPDPDETAGMGEDSETSDIEDIDPVVSRASLEKSIYPWQFTPRTARCAVLIFGHRYDLYVGRLPDAALCTWCVFRDGREIECRTCADFDRAIALAENAAEAWAEQKWRVYDGGVSD